MHINEYRARFFEALKIKDKYDKFQAVNGLFAEAFVGDDEFRADLLDLAEINQLELRIAEIKDRLSGDHL